MKLFTISVSLGTILSIVFLIASFAFANLAIISPTGVTSYTCYTDSVCFTPSIEDKLAGLYFGTGVALIVITGLVGWITYPLSADDEEES